MTLLSPTASRPSLGNPLRFLAAVNRYILDSIPEVSARTLAIYRIVFCGLFLAFWMTSVAPGSLRSMSVRGPKHWINSFEPIVFLSSINIVTEGLYYAVVFLTLAFAAGLFSRVVYPLLVIAIWMAVFFWNQNHFFSPLLLAVTTALPARWSDDLSVDRILGFARPLKARSRIYGYPIWLMGLCIALAYTAAGFSKLVMTNGAWLWDTGSRWGFITDLNLAVTDWGLISVNNYWLAVLASAFASFGQIIYLYSCFTRSIWIKTAIGAFIAVPFLVGLVLAMGLFWWPWALLVVLLYIPWAPIGKWLDRLDGGFLPTAPLPSFAPHARWALCVTWTLLFIHAYAVVFKKSTELEPIVSNFDMYAITFPMGTESELANWREYEKHGRHYITVINATMPNGDTLDLTGRHRLADFLQRVDLAKLGIGLSESSLNGRDIWRYFAKSAPLPVYFCENLRGFFQHNENGLPQELIFAKRFHGLVNGRFEILPVQDKVVVDIANTKCPYTVSRDRSIQ